MFLAIRDVPPAIQPEPPTGDLKLYPAADAATVMVRSGSAMNNNIAVWYIC